MKCKELIHPFQNDSGVSQRQRMMDDLLNSSALIDARNLADMLDYFQKLAKHINYYDSDLNVSNWQPFFQNSLPFTIAAIIKFDQRKINDKLQKYLHLFDKNPSKASLQLLVNFVYYAIIKPILGWNIKLKNSELPISLFLAKLIKDNLSDSLKLFILELNTAVKWFQIKTLNFSDFLNDEDWNLDITDLYSIKSDDAFYASGLNDRDRIIYTKNQIKIFSDSFLDNIDAISKIAENSLELSFEPLTDEFKEKVSPHLALLFTFLKLFKYVQNDLNTFTKKHIDFFYKEVLFLKPKDAFPDKVHVVFEIQNQIQKYLLKEGILVKDAKDANKREILFSLDDQIVVNKTKIAEVKTLFLNNEIHGKSTYLKGLHIANKANMADGVDKPFKDISNPSWSTLGAELSKYKDPEHKFTKPFPHARIGFVLASEVLLLKEAERNIEINVVCEINNFCTESLIINDLFDQFKQILNQEFYPINRDLISLAYKNGISKELGAKLESKLSKVIPNENMISCSGEIREEIFETILTNEEFKEWNLTDPEKLSFLAIIKPIKAINIAFSGEKDWIIPDNNPTISISELYNGNKFKMTISVELSEDKESITYYDDEILKEGFHTKFPLLKVEFDDRIKLDVNISKNEDSFFCKKESKEYLQQVSTYQFFRNVRFSSYFNTATNKTESTNIKVKVCGLKNLIVQNSESLQNVNGPIYPFGTRPEIIDFDIKNQPKLNVDTDINLIGPDFYIGSQEVFSKKWDDITVNLNWKDKPTNFRDYYKGYLQNEDGFGLDENKFFINLSILENGKWKGENNHSSPNTSSVNILGKVYNNRRLFESNGNSECIHKNPYEQTIKLNKSHFALNQKFIHSDENLEKYEVNSTHGFLKINLQFQDFCHKVYSYVLARQMMALGKLPDSKLEDAIYYDASGNLVVFRSKNIIDDINNAKNISLRVNQDVNASPDGIKARMGNIGNTSINVSNANRIRRIVLPYDPLNPSTLNNLANDASNLNNTLNTVYSLLDNNVKYQAVIPNEPWTPIIKNLCLDYSATAEIKDVEIIHLYPYPQTFKKEELNHNPSMLPTFCDEGNLFIALQEMEPGTNVNILFQMAEATADSESPREPVNWYYLENNSWKNMRTGFEVLDDDTHGLTTSGIIKFAIPGSITNDNTILPNGMYWLKASIPKNSKSVSEIIGIHTQAIKATFTNEILNDKLRLNTPLPAGSISKLKESDSYIKKVDQPYESFNGRIPESQGHFYIRVSELLKHKNRAIQKFDYERLTLEAFPQLYKVKCINHSFALDAHQYINDFPMAPGYIILAVIPDLNILKASEVFEPRVPVSLLENIQKFIKERCSPFVRLRVMNPSYEGVNICIKVKLHPGKDEQFYKDKLKQELREFLAPWAVGKFDKLSFGQCIYQSDIVGFIESRDYINYIIDLRMQHEDDEQNIITNSQKVVCPITPRSILIASNIDVLIEQQDCERWESPKIQMPCSNVPIPIENYCKNYKM